MYTLQIITGREPFKVVDLTDGGESFFADKIEAYQRCALLKSLGRNYRLEVR